MSRTTHVLVGPGRPLDLILVCVIVAAAVLLSTYGVGGPLQWGLAFLAVFFAPGYALVSALFPGQKAILSQSYMLRREERLIDISLLERLALGFGLGATLMALAGSVITRGLLRLDPILVGLEAAAFTFLFSGLAIYRRSHLPGGDQFALTVRERSRKVQWTVAERGTAVIIIAAVVVLMAVTANGLNAHPAANPFSEISVTGADGNLQHLPTTLAADQEGLIKVTVVSHLTSTQRFTVTLSLVEGASASSSFDPGSAVSVSSVGAKATSFDLASGGKWERTIAFSIHESGQKTLYITLNDGLEVKQLWLPLTIS